MRRSGCRWIAATAAVGTLIAGCGGDDGSAAVSSGSATTSVTSVASSPASQSLAAVIPQGFDTGAIQLRRADGTICELCTYIARTQTEHALGLMGVTDLDGHDGMIFAFDEPAPHAFWMKNTVMPLSAAWFAADGAFAAGFDMEPCPPGTGQCPTYGPDTPVLHVLEVPQGDLVRLGITEGSALVSVGGPCEPRRK